jgi:type IV secretion system protein TrbJ
MMKKTPRLPVLMPLVAAILLVDVPASEAQLFGGPSIVYDPIHHATTALDLAESLVQTATQVEMLRDMIENSIRGGSPEWGELVAIIDQLDDVLRTGQAITHSLENVSGRFKASYPGFDPADDYSKLYQQWSRELLDTLSATLAAAGVNARDARDVDEVLQKLSLRNRRAKGRMQALQIANSLASRELEELAKLRQLVATSISAQNVYLATTEARDAASVASFKRFLDDRPIEIPSEQRQRVPLLHLAHPGGNQ